MHHAKKRFTQEIRPSGTGSFLPTHFWANRHSPAPVSAVLPAGTLHNLRLQAEAQVLDLLHPKMGAVVKQPAVAREAVALFAGVPQPHVPLQLLQPH